MGYVEPSEPRSAPTSARRDARTHLRTEGERTVDASWIDRWRGRRICVVGDVMLDRFVYGHVERVSPEAPIPVLKYGSEKAMLGGAANVARNVVALGGEAVLIGVLGRDADGDMVADRLTPEIGRAHV